MPRSAPLEPESIALIRFRDCDPFGHLSNARYADYFQEAREDHLRLHYGLDIYKHAAQTGFSWYVTRAQTAFLAPAQLGESVLIRTRLLRFEESLVQVEALMMDAAGRQLKSLCWFHFRYVELKKGRSAPHGPELRETFDPVVYREDGMETVDFEARVTQVLKTFKGAA